jgi:hypothetical protein
MLSALGATVDRRIAGSMVSRARRRWPLLRFVPAGWIRPLLLPTATVVRREISRSVTRTLLPAAVVVAALLLLGGG